MRALLGTVASLALGLSFQAAAADWPTVRGNPQHTGWVAGELQPPFRLVWAREFEGERLGTAVEPIVAHGKVFVGTHAGNLYALEADSGAGIWRFQAHGAFLHSPAVTGQRVLAASVDGHLYALQTRTGELDWRWFGGHGGFSASPTVAGDSVFIGTRAGDFVSLRVDTGRLLWKTALGVPIRQTAAAADGRVWVTGEDLHVRCLDARDGRYLWTSEQLAGQTARDYYPIVARNGGRTFVIVRSSPVLNMAQRIGQDRTLLCRNAGVDDSSWQKVDAWIKSEAARGTPELWAREQQAIRRCLATNRTARSFYVLDGLTGREMPFAPVLWAAGCQAVGAPPALTADGRLLVFYRSAYGNWNHGVAPLVALGLLDLSANSITPLFHQQGAQPRWNAFWGTADESQNFLVIGNTVLIIHQGTLSGFDLQKNELFTIAGERDTYGGFQNPPWARNEWHGPARSGVAVVGTNVYWQTGSRILRLVSGLPALPKGTIQPQAVSTAGLPTATVPIPPALDSQSLRQQLTQVAEDVLSQVWAPLFVDPGLAGRDFSFDDSAELFEALAWAFPHLPRNTQHRVKDRLGRQWRNHPPFTSEGRYSLKDGARREWFWLPHDYCVRAGSDRPPHPFGGVYAAWLYGRRCDEQSRVRESWPAIKAAFEDFLRAGWQLDEQKGDLFANRYLSALIAVQQLAEQSGDTALAARASAKRDETAGALIAWWKRAAGGGTLEGFKTSAELDPFIGRGGGYSLAVAPHRHKLALFQDLTPEVAELVRAEVPEAIETVWRSFERLHRTWPLVGEERQVHTGENFVDPPDLALSGFKALVWLRQGSSEELRGRVDLPFCRADLYYLEKLALALSSK